MLYFMHPSSGKDMYDKFNFENVAIFQEMLKYYWKRF